MTITPITDYSTLVTDSFLLFRNIKGKPEQPISYRYFAESVIKVRIPVIYLPRVKTNMPKFAIS